MRPRHRRTACQPEIDTSVERRGSTILVLLALVSVPLFALVWGVPWILRRTRAVPMLHVRALPLCAWLSFAGGTLVAPGVVFFQENAAVTFGRMTAWSIALAAAGWAFAAFSVASLVAALRAWKRRKTMNPFAYHYSLAVAVLFVVAAVYLAWGGVIGYRGWA